MRSIIFLIILNTYAFNLEDKQTKSEKVDFNISDSPDIQPEIPAISNTFTDSDESIYTPNDSDDYQPAYFIGGDSALSHFIDENLTWPYDIYYYTGTITVIVSFVVKKDGRITNLSIKETSCNRAFDNESLRVVKKMNGRYYPAIVNGKFVNTNCSQKIIFEFD